ncbi:MAG: hypothetical protein HEQ32_09150 [Vampirovibrio sp.]
MMTETIKCPLTGLDAIIEEKNTQCSIIRLQGIEECNYSFPSHTKAGLNEETIKVFEDLTKNDLIKKGKLLRWLYLKTQMSKKQKTPLKIPPLSLELLSDDSANKETFKTEREFISEVEDVFEQKITPTQKLDWLLEYIYHDVESLGTKKSIPTYELLPVLATVEAAEVRALLKTLAQKGLCISDDKGRLLHEAYSDVKNTYKFCIQLTLEGFEAYDALMKGKAHSNFGFLALEFDELNLFYPKLKEFLKQEMKIDLKDQGDANRLGNINVAIEANIRKCKFMIADIIPTQKIKKNKDIPNANVMWEAGFAEGLNKPVLYICKQIAKNAPFDVRNHYCIEYGETEETHQKACTRIKEALENTFAQRGE